MEIRKTERINNIIHNFFFVYMVGLFVNYYYWFIDLPFNLVVLSIVILGIATITCSVWYNCELKKNYQKNGFRIYECKRSKFPLVLTAIGFMVLHSSYGAYTEIMSIVFSIGIYLLASAAIRFIAGKLFKINFLVLTDESIIDLNGRNQSIDYSNIRSYVVEDDKIRIKERFVSHRIYAKEFVNSQNMLGEIEAKIANY